MKVSKIGFIVIIILTGIGFCSLMVLGDIPAKIYHFKFTKDKKIKSKKQAELEKDTNFTEEDLEYVQESDLSGDSNKKIKNQSKKTLSLDISLQPVKIFSSEDSNSNINIVPFKKDSSPNTKKANQKPKISVKSNPASQKVTKHKGKVSGFKNTDAIRSAAKNIVNKVTLHPNDEVQNKNFKSLSFNSFYSPQQLKNDSLEHEHNSSQPQSNEKKLDNSKVKKSYSYSKNDTIKDDDINDYPGSSESREEKIADRRRSFSPNPGKDNPSYGKQNSSSQEQQPGEFSDKGKGRSYSENPGSSESREEKIADRRRSFSPNPGKDNPSYGKQISPPQEQQPGEFSDKGKGRSYSDTENPSDSPSNSQVKANNSSAASDEITVAVIGITPVNPNDPDLRGRVTTAGIAGNQTHCQNVTETLATNISKDVNIKVYNVPKETTGYNLKASIVKAVNEGAKVINISLGPDIKAMKKDIKEQYRNKYGRNPTTKELKYYLNRRIDNYYNKGLRPELEYAKQKGVAVVLAAGNNGGKNYALRNLGDMENVFIAGATDPNGLLSNNLIASFSDQAQFYTKGVYKKDSFDLSDGLSNEDIFTGTSAAAPTLTAMIYEMLKQDPTMSFDEIRTTLKESSIDVAGKNIINETPQLAGVGDASPPTTSNNFNPQASFSPPTSPGNGFESQLGNSGSFGSGLSGLGTTPVF